MCCHGGVDLRGRFGGLDGPGSHERALQPAEAIRGSAGAVPQVVGARAPPGHVVDNRRCHFFDGRSDFRQVRRRLALRLRWLKGASVKSSTSKAQRYNTTHVFLIDTTSY